jgi:hypothetical protein
MLIYLCICVGPNYIFNVGMNKQVKATIFMATITRRLPPLFD